MSLLRNWLLQRLQAPYLRMVAVAVVIVGVMLAMVGFMTSDRGRTALGIPLGADFAGFFVAAQILQLDQSSALYDQALHHQLYHQLLPNIPAGETIPYVHPPFVAGVLQPLTWLPYEAAVAFWMLISAALYILGLVLLLQAFTPAFRSQRILMVLLALSFEPFLFECWLGGQLSAIGFAGFAACYYLLQRNKPLSAGLALGMSFYKPTLLFLMIPCLLAGRCWRLLLGMTFTGVALVLASIALAGWDVNVHYLEVLASFRKSTAEGELAIRLWKYVDMNHALKLALGTSATVQWVFVALATLPTIWLLFSWWRASALQDRTRDLLWAATLAWVPLVNLYFGIYDSILVVQSVLIAAGALIKATPASSFSITALPWLLIALYLSPWINQSLAGLLRVPAYSLALLAWGIYMASTHRTATARARDHLGA